MVKLILYIAGISLAGIGVFFLIFNLIIRKVFQLPQIKNPATPADYGFDYREYFIPTVNHKKIQLWDLNPDVDAPVLLGVHGWANTSASLLPLAKDLAKKWRILLVNTRNHGDSEFEGYSTMPHYADDILSAVQFIKEKHLPEYPVILLGHSMGAASSLYAAGKDERIKGVVAVSSFADLEEMMRTGFIKSKLPKNLINGLMRYIEFRIGARLSVLSPVNSVKKLKVPVLLIHGEQDNVVPFEDMNRIFQVAGAKKRIETFAVPDHDHSSLLSEKAVAKEIDAFLESHFPVSRKEASSLVGKK